MALKNLRKSKEENEETATSAPVTTPGTATADASVPVTGTTSADTASDATSTAAPGTHSPKNPRGPGLRWNEDRDRALVLALRTVGGDDPQALLDALNETDAFADVGAENITLQKVRSRRNRLNEDVFVPAGKTLPEIAIKRGGYVPDPSLANLFDGEGASASV